MYWSRYELDFLRARAVELRRWPADADCWCVFDNTTLGLATDNALSLKDHIEKAKTI